MYPTIDLGPIELQTFGLFFALSFVVSGLIVGWRLRELGMVVDWAYEMIFAALAGGVIGAKLWYVIETGNNDLSNVFSGTGLTWYGGALGGALAVLAYTKWRAMAPWTVADICAPALAAGYAVGRIGCQLSGDGDYGPETDMWWGMGYPNGTVPTAPGVEVHPTPIFETLLMGGAALLLWRLRGRFADGVLIGIYLVLAGVERFVVEFVRLNDPVLVGLTTAQLVSIGLVVSGVAVIAARRAKPGPAIASAS